MQQKIDIKKQAYKKNPDGTWSTIINTDIVAPIGDIRIGKGVVFSRGQKICGIDVVELLDQHSH